jgi:hypothetical protein
MLVLGIVASSSRPLSFGCSCARPRRLRDAASPPTLWHGVKPSQSLRGVDHPRHVFLGDLDNLHFWMNALLGLRRRVDEVKFTDDGIVGEAHDDHVAAHLGLAPSLDPQIVHVVQVSVGKDW